MPDPAPDSPRRSAWRTYRRCLETLVELDVGAGVILQDDTVACAGFERAARAAFAARPGRLISFFHSTSPLGNMRHMEHAYRTCDPFFEWVSGTWVSTVALGWPVELAREFLEWSDSVQIRPERITDDPVVGRWARETKRGALATAPSLVEHPDDVVTVVGSARGTGDRRDDRMAACWIGDVPVDEWIALLA